MDLQDGNETTPSYVAGSSEVEWKRSRMREYMRGYRKRRKENLMDLDEGSRDSVERKHREQVRNRVRRHRLRKRLDDEGLSKEEIEIQIAALNEQLENESASSQDSMVRGPYSTPWKSAIPAMSVDISSPDISLLQDLCSSLKPEDWSCEDVEIFFGDLGLAEIQKAISTQSIDGRALLNLSEKDLLSTLNLSPRCSELFISSLSSLKLLLKQK